MKNMGIVMSFSGSVILVIYFILYPFSKRHFSIGWHRHILIASIIYNIFPFPNFKYIFLDMISFIFPVSRQADSIISFTQEASIYIYHDGFLFSEAQKTILIISGILIAISLSVLCSQLGYYFYMKHIFLNKKVDSANDHQKELLLKKVTAELNSKHTKDIQIRVSPFIAAPMVIGIWKPTIIIPSNATFDDEELSFILRHELCHIKNHDLLWRFLALFIIGIHWYNPLSYLLFAQYGRVSEIFCDVKATQDLDIKAKKKYCSILIDLSTSAMPKSNKLFSAGLLGYEKSKLLVKQRISEVMKMKKSSKFLSSIVASFILLAGSLTVLAYNTPIVLNDADPQNTDGKVSDILTIVYDLSLDDCFIDFSGNISPIQDDEKSKAICVHQFQWGYAAKHNSYSDGSCKVTLYNCQQCKKCGYTKWRDRASSQNYNPCPH